MPRERTTTRTLTLDPYFTLATVENDVLLLLERRWVAGTGWVDKKLRVRMTPDMVTTIASALWQYQKDVAKRAAAMAADLRGV